MPRRSLKALIGTSAIAMMLLVTILFSISYGSTGFKPFYLLIQCRNPILELRVARTLFAILTGLALAVAGTLIQAATRNPLASPSILGLQSGALTAVLLAILVSGILTRTMLIVFAFLGSFAAYTLATAIASLAGMTATALILGGIAIASMLSGLSHLLLYLVQSKLFGQPMLILLGSVSIARPSEAPLYALATLCGIATAIAMWKRVNAILLGDDFATQLGYDPRTTRLILASLASILTAVSVSFVGIVSFVGLIAPHIARLVVGDDARKHIPLSAVSGALIVLLADVFVRAISASSTMGELPISIPTSIVGAAVLSYLVISRTRG